MRTYNNLHMPDFSELTSQLAVLDDDSCANFPDDLSAKCDERVECVKCAACVGSLTHQQPSRPGTDTDDCDGESDMNDLARSVPQQDGLSTDYPPPRSVTQEKEFYWDEDDDLINNFRALARRLAACEDLYRRPGYADGLLMATGRQNVETRVIDCGRLLAPVIVDRLRVRFVQGGQVRGHCIPTSYLNTMLASEGFLQQFAPLDGVVFAPHYLPDFVQMRPGYNDGGRGQRFLYAGQEIPVENGLDAINAFLDVMAFETNADRTNAVALALTVQLRNYWAGAKPVGVVTSVKSHGGKDTIVAFAAGSTPKVSVDYQSTDWAFRNGLVATLTSRPDAGVVNVENARLDRSDRFIASATLERFLTDPAPTIHSSKARDALKIHNHMVFTITTNFGTVSEDLMNRALPIHLNPVGNITDRASPIGNPKLEYLPAQCERIEAELRGMIEQWKKAGRPLDEAVKHPFIEWARTIGGILQVSGFKDFLGNYSHRKTTDDPLRRALGLLGAASPDLWLRSAKWAQVAVDVGVERIVIPQHDRDSDRGRERGIGVVLSAHQGETFSVEMEDERLVLRLERARRRFDGAGQPPTTRYRFVVLGREGLPADPGDGPEPEDVQKPAGAFDASDGRFTEAPSYDGLKCHNLDDNHRFFTGRLPNELVLTPAQFEELWRLHPAEYHEIMIHGGLKKTPRWQQAFVEDYHYTGRVNEALPLPPLLLPIWEWARATIDGRLQGTLLNWYDGKLGHYIGAHRDSTTNMIEGAPIVTISLGEERVFRLRLWKGKGYRDFLATNGTVFVLPFAANLQWTHEVPHAVGHTGRRISVTLRAFDERAAGASLGSERKAVSV